MKTLFDNIRHHARTRPDQLALSGSSASLTYAQLSKRIEWLSQSMRDKGVRRMAILADNSLEWALADLAAMHLGIPCIPLPTFFSSLQLEHCLRDSQPDLIITDRPEMLSFRNPSAYAEISLYELNSLTALRPISQFPSKPLPRNTWKISYTSGTTGDPKGVCLALNTLMNVASALLQVTGGNSDDHHLSVLPLATLLENIGGLYTPLLAGASIHLPSQEALSAATLPEGMHHLLHLGRDRNVTTTILTPHLLALWCRTLAQQDPPSLSSLRFVAVGGARVPLGLLQQATRLGLPVFEGYGLSECASVVSLNPPNGRRPGTVGQPLPHQHIMIAPDGEILVKGARFLGYLGGPIPNQHEWWGTGDLGFLDDEGFLSIVGRKKHLFITSQGRNISPEWLEHTLAEHPELAQVAVFGEGFSQPIAIVIPAEGCSEDGIAQAIRRANSNLPDYAAIGQWIIASTPFTPHNGMLTSNGRLRRDAIWARYAGRFPRHDALPPRPHAISHAA